MNTLELLSSIETTSDMIFVAEPAQGNDGKPLIVCANAAMSAEFGHEVNGLAGKRLALLAGTRTDEDAMLRLCSAIETMSEASFELRLYRADGSAFWSEWDGHKLEDENGIPGRWIASGRNVDERRRTEDRLKLLSMALDAADDAILICSVRAGEDAPRIRYANRAALSQSGFTVEDIENARRLGPLSGEGVVAEVLSAMRRGEPMRRLTRLYRKDGSTYWASQSFQPIRDRSGGHSQFVCVERDVSETVEREEVRSDLMAMIGHDLRNPLAGILGYSELLLEMLGAGDPSYDAVRHIRVSARRLESLAAEMLTVCLLDRDEYRPRFEAIDLGQLTEDILSYFADRARIDVIIRASVLIRADSVGIRHVIENLLSNALKFSAAASRVTVEIARSDGSSTIRFSDSGIGIPEADLPLIFDRSSRARNVGKRRGTGLGLSFVKRLVEINKGDIEVASTEDVGTTFTVRFSDDAREPPGE